MGQRAELAELLQEPDEWSGADGSPFGAEPQSRLRTEGIVVKVSGELDRGTAPKFRMRMVQILALPLDALTLDLEAVTHIDQAGWAALTTARREAQFRGIAFTLVPAQLPGVDATEHSEGFD
jgi:anti-anti-sigma factor